MSDEAKTLLEQLKKMLLDSEVRWTQEPWQIVRDDEFWFRCGVLDSDPLLKQMYADVVFLSKVMTERRLQLCAYLRRQAAIETPATEAVVDQQKATN